MTCASLACARPPQGGPIGCSTPHAPLEGSFHVWPGGSLDTPPRGLSHATPLGGCCVTVHDPSPAQAGGSCLPCQGVSPTRASRPLSPATAPPTPPPPPTPVFATDLDPPTALPTLTDPATGDTCSIAIDVHPSDATAVYWTMRQFLQGDDRPYATRRWSSPRPRGPVRVRPLPLLRLHRPLGRLVPAPLPPTPDRPRIHLTAPPPPPRPPSRGPLCRLAPAPRPPRPARRRADRRRPTPSR